MGFVAKKSNNSEYFITFGKKKYAFDLDEIKKFCLISSDQSGREKEITEAYEFNEETSQLTLTSKIDREVKGTGNPQNDMIIYDIVKLFIMALLDNQAITEEFVMDFSTSLAINTLIKWNMLVEVE